MGIIRKWGMTRRLLSCRQEKPFDKDALIMSYEGEGSCIGNGQRHGVHGVSWLAKVFPLCFLFRYPPPRWRFLFLLVSFFVNRTWIDAYIDALDLAQHGVWSPDGGIPSSLVIDNQGQS